MDYNENILDELDMLINELKEINTASLKTNALLQYPGCKKLLWWTYNPYKKFGVSSKTVEKYRSSNLVDYEKSSSYTIYDLLRDLNSRKLTGNAALEKCASFVNAYKEYRELVYCIFDRGFKQGVSLATINATFKNFIPVFSCARAKDYWDYEKVVDFSIRKWYSSRKLDGVRVEGYIDGKSDLHPYSRDGNEFSTLQVLKDAIKKSGIKNIWLSGEFCLVDDKGNEDFQLAVGEVKKKDYTISNPRWYIYDCCTPEEHDTGMGDLNTPFSIRYEQYTKICEKINSEHIIALEQFIIESKEQLLERFSEARENGWEGLVIHEDVRYYGQKNGHILKMKEFFDDEYEVKDIEIGPVTYYVDVDDYRNPGKVIKKRISKDMVSRLVIEHKGYLVGVGSGLTIKQRQLWKKKPHLIIGKTITVKYFGETKNRNGGFSLRFPTLKAIYNGKRDI